MIRFLILVGYFEITMYLQLTGKLNQYINLHYSYLAYLSMILSFILAVVQLIIWMKKMEVHSHLNTRWQCARRCLSDWPTRAVDKARPVW